MRSIAKLFAFSAPLCLLAVACGGSDTYVQPTAPQQPVTVVQPAPAVTAAPPPATKVEIEHND